nr:MAG TPA: hypothetical protein [Caudoviricetes sp.]
MRSIFIYYPPLKTYFSFLFSFDLIIYYNSEDINGLYVFKFYSQSHTTAKQFYK